MPQLPASHDLSATGRYAAARDLERLLHLHGELARRLGASDDPEAVLRALVVAATGCAGIDCAGVYLLDPAAREFRLVAHTGISSRFAEEVAHVPEDSPFAREVVTSVQPVHETTQSYFAEAMRREGMRDALAIPVRIGKEVLAALNVGTKTLPVIPENTQSILQTMSGHVGAAIARQRAFAAQRELRLNLETFFDTMDDLIVVVDLKGHILHHNRAFAENLGCARGELRDADIANFLTPEHLAEAKGFVPDLRAGRVVSRQLPLLARDGRAIPTETKAVLGTWGGNEAVHIVARDISDRLASEAELRRLATAIEQAAESFVITDRDGNIEYVNPAFERLTGYKRAEAIGQQPRILKSGCHSPQFYAEMWHKLVNGETWSGRLTNRRRDGSFFVEEATISPVRDRAGEITHFVAVKRDVTREVDLEERLRESQKLEAIGTLAGGIAHDFNNILYALLGYAHLALDDLPPNSAAESSLREVLRAAERGSDLVRQMLAFGRRAEQERRSVPLQPLIEEVLVLVRGSLPASIAIETAVDPDCGAVMADTSQIHQVVLNLCTNAYRAMEEGGKLTVTLDEIDHDGDPDGSWSDLAPGRYALLSVRDTGRGMSEDVQARIFEPFFTTRPNNEGAGLGLAIVHGIVKGHGGAIRVQTAPNAGSLFEVALPISASASPTEEAAEPPATSRPARNTRVLVVDDEPMIVNLTVKTLNRLGMVATGCREPEEAFALFRQDPDAFDVVVTDQTMPGMSGLCLTEELLKLRPDLPIIMATGYSAEANEERARAIGVRCFVQKPVDLRDLAASIERLSEPVSA